MGKEVIENGQTGLVVRTALNDNFTELYTGAETVAADAKVTPVDADVLPLQDSAASNVKKKVTWANIKTVLQAAFNSVYFVKGTDDTDNISEGSSNLYFTDKRAVNAPGRKDTSAALDFDLYDDWAITAGGSQQLAISNDINGVFFKTFEITGGSLNATLFTHATKAITLTENATLANYDSGEINDIVGKFTIGAAIVIDIILKVRA